MGLARARQVLTCLSILLCTWTTYSHVLTHDGIRSVNEPKPEFFIDSIFDKYATNSSISLREFKGLLKELQIGAISRENTGKIAPSAKENVAKNGDSKCYPAEDLFQSYSIGTSGLDKKQFEGICPAIVQQIDSGACIDASDHEEEEIRQSKTQAWGYGFLAVTIISCASLLGAFVVPFMSQWFYKILLLFMVSLAVGVLSGSGIFHLIPHAFQLGKLPDGSYNYSYLWKCLTIIGGIYLFFVLEYVMKMIVRFKEKALQATEQNGLESNHVKSELPSAGIADVQLQLYNTAADHHHTHGNVFCLNPKLSDKDGVHVEVKDKSTSNCLIKSELKDKKSPKQKKRVAPVAWMIIIGDGLHNFIDGLAIGASFSTSNYVGISTSLAIFCEELPHELGDFAVLLNAGMNYKKAMGFNFLSACACYAGLVIGLLLGYTTSAVSWIYALAGGMFIYISLVDMLEEATEMSVKIGATSIKKNLQTFALQNFGMLLGFAVMLILAQYGTDIAVR